VGVFGTAYIKAVKKRAINGTGSTVGGFERVFLLMAIFKHLTKKKNPVTFEVRRQKKTGLISMLYKNNKAYGDNVNKAERHFYQCMRPKWGKVKRKKGQEYKTCKTLLPAS
jgi:uncharacterized C2H2 Zn-finger protein